MEKSRLGIIFIFIGVLLFIIFLFFVLPLPDYYLISLFGLLISVILIAVGFAYSRDDETIERQS
jgi:hypothetical protein